MRKSKPSNEVRLRKEAAPDVEIKFSFKLFDHLDEEMCPGEFPSGYTQSLMRRLRDLSSWTVKRFTTQQDKSVRNHTHDWSKTARPNGFSSLNERFRDYPGWQFCISANEHGRVHGLIMNDTFYVIWLDHQHNLYP